MKEIVPQEIIQQKIFLIRGHKVMLDEEVNGLRCQFGASSLKSQIVPSSH